MKRYFTTDYLNSLAKEAHEISCANGFYEEGSKPVHLLNRLILSEYGELVETHRAGNKPNEQANYARLPQSPDIYKATWKGTMEEELADIAIRVADMTGMLNKHFSPIEFKQYDYDFISRALLGSYYRSAAISHDLAPERMICIINKLNEFGNLTIVDYTEEISGLLYELMETLVDMTVLYLQTNRYEPQGIPFTEYDPKDEARKILSYHIELKMAYNRTREYKHGKTY